jgi:hypothetical protein
MFLTDVGLLLWKKYQDEQVVSQSWNFSEWMINYEGGFVRRGLAGQILLQAHQFLGVDFTITVQVLTTVIYLFVLAYVSLRILKLSSKAWILLFLIFNPSLMIFPVLDGSVFRKDLIPVLITIIHILLIESSANQNKEGNFVSSLYRDKSFFLISLPTIILSLMHETISLLTFMPLNIFLSTAYLIRVDKLSHKPTFIKLVGIYSGGIFACVISFLARGSHDTAKSICLSWQGIINSIDCTLKLPPAVDALQWSIKEALWFSSSLISSGGFLMYFFVLMAITAVSVSSMASLSHQDSTEGREPSLFYANVKQRRELIIHLYLSSLIFSFPIYILGWDWGRYFFVSSMQICVVALSPLTLSMIFEFARNNGGIHRVCKAVTTKNRSTKFKPDLSLFTQTYAKLFKSLKEFSLLAERNKTTTFLLLLACGLPTWNINLRGIRDCNIIVRTLESAKVFLDSF